MRILSALVAVCAVALCLAQSGSPWVDSTAAYWNRMDAEFADTAHSPLTPEDLARFEHLDRFAPDSMYCVLARFTAARKQKRFGMRTSTDRVPMYRDMGTLTFTLNGKNRVLHVYQNIELVKQEKYRNHLFVPFTDLTNDVESYGGGRYLDLEGPLEHEVILDFNRAYNPYCAYGGAYSCPIPPPENHLAIAVPAGVKKYHD